MNDDELRELTKGSMTRILNSLVDNYMKIYDEYYAEGSRESAFLKDLADSILPISEVLEVYTRENYINPDYAVRKLKHSKDIIEDTIKFFELKQEKKGQNEREK